MVAQEKLLIVKLDEFIRKYYLNRLIRGVLLSVGLVLAFYLLYTTLEYFGHFGSVARTFFFYSFIFATGLSVSIMVIRPILHLWKLGDTVSYDEAARIIGDHFGDVGDKLLNTLQLQRNATIESSDLLLASIDQRIAQMQPVPFTSAIDLSQNKRFLKYALPPVAVLLLLLAFVPSLITESTRRIVRYRSSFNELAPFKFNIQNKNLSTLEMQDYKLDVTLDGNEVPKDVYLEMNGQRLLMNRSNAANFSFVFRQPKTSLEFNLSAGGYHSAAYTLKVLPKPSVLSFDISLEFPSYIGRSPEHRKNSGDLLVPAGTKISWSLLTSATKDVGIMLLDSLYVLKQTSQNNFSFSKRFLKTADYAILCSNDYLTNGDSLRYTVTVIPDLYPSISVTSAQDSLHESHMYFNGQMRDDHGLTALNLRYRLLTGASDTAKFSQLPITIKTGAKSDEFFYYWDMGQLHISPGDQVEYYFEVWDNDQVNGSKSARTDKRMFRMATFKELAEQNEEKSKNIRSEISESLKMAGEMKRNLNQMQQTLLDKKTLSWEEKKKMENLLQAQKALKKKLSLIQQENKDRTVKINEITQFDPQLVEKQNQLEKLFNEIMSDEMKKLFDEMEKLLDELTKDEAKEMLDEMKFSNEDLEKELDRSLELFKQLEFEQKAEQTIQRLEELAKEQKELAEKSLKNPDDNQTLKDEQQKTSDSFEDIKEAIDDLEKKNAELEHPNQMEDMSEEEQSVSEKQKDSEDKLEQKQNKKASKSQKEASEKMSQMAKKMAGMMMQMQSQGQQEDMDALRQIVDNLLTLSFDQEDLMGNVKKTDQNDPRYTDLAREQMKLKDDSKLIEDSLYALSKRVPQIETVVNREIRSVKGNMAKAIENMTSRHPAEVLSRQQFALTSLNNLALMLSETVQQMQQASAAQMGGKGSCKKPGGSGSPSAASMRKLQEQLNKQLENMKKGMKPGGKKDGQKPGGLSPGNSGMSRQLAKMAARQEALRNMARQYDEQHKKTGRGEGAGDNMKELGELMDQTETDLVNKMITQETLMRQRKILSRLLDAEKAEQEMGQEKRRESQEGKNEDYGNLEIFFEYMRRKNNETELLRTVPPNLIPFYREKVDEYFKKQAE